jgi:hypothetical protein
LKVSFQTAGTLSPSFSWPLATAVLLPDDGIDAVVEQLLLLQSGGVMVLQRGLSKGGGGWAWGPAGRAHRQWGWLGGVGVCGKGGW